jgi:hypothetical protein
LVTWILRQESLGYAPSLQLIEQHSTVHKTNAGCILRA